MTANAGPRARAPDKAKAPALKLVPGGHATAVERDSEKGATWEVEGRKTDGSIVDLRLAANSERVAMTRTPRRATAASSRDAVAREAASPLGRLPVRLRVTLTFAGVMALLLAATGLFVYLRLESELDATITRACARARATSARIAPATREASNQAGFRP